MKKWLQKNKKIIKLACIILIISVIGAYIVDLNSKVKTKDMEEVTYNEFLTMVEEGKVDTVYYSTSKEVMTFTLFNEETKNMTKEERKDYKYKLKDYRKTLYPAYDDFRKDMLTADVTLSVVNSSILVTILANSGTIVLIVLWIYMIRKMVGGPKGFEKDKLLQTSTVKFDNVIGHDEVLDDVKFIVRMLKEPELGKNLGVEVPRGILFSGEPGTGKTLIAKAIAGEAGVPFIYASASQFNELFVGMGAKRVRELFKVAKENSPCILFIDEIDAVGGNRNRSGRSSEDDQTINALLTEMDGFSARDNIFIIAATNRPEHLDKALTRAGRFDRQVCINAPKDWTVRKDMFDYYLRNTKLTEDVDVISLSKQVIGFTGADIASICNEAGIIALMNEKSAIDMASLEEAIDKRLFKGNRSKSDKYNKDKEIVAYHEAGHAVVTYLQHQPISRASIISTTSGVGGFVMQSETDSVFTTDTELYSQILIAYAGRASEKIKFNTVTTGAQNDITQATNIMLSYIQKYGFDSDFGLLDIAVLSDKQVINADDITERLSEMSKKLYNETLELLNKNYNLVEKLAQKLLEVETMSGEDIKVLLES